MSYDDKPELGVGRTVRIVMVVGIVLLFVLLPFAFLVGQCALTGDCL